MADGFGFLEGPRWRDGRLWVSDLLTKQIICLDTTGSKRTLEVSGRPSGLGFLPDGALLVATMEEQTVLRHDGAGFVVHADLSGVLSGMCNDMVVDGAGNAYVGGTGLPALGAVPVGEPPPGEIVLVRPDSGVEIVAEGLAIPNGLAVTPDRSTLVVAETAGARLSAFPIEPDGRLGARRTFAELPGRMPDGICADAEGAVWMADASGGCCLRIVDGGELVDWVDFDHPVVSCALGGPGRGTLFAVGATRLTFNPDRPRTGLVASVPVDVPGAGWP